MPRSSSGKSVARAASTGGGTTYRGQMPVNWYAALVVIVLIGLGSIALAKFHYNQGAAAVEPIANQTTWHAALAVDVCGSMQAALPASPAGASSTNGLISTGSGVLQVAPKTASQAGTNATLGKFASGYSGMVLTNTELKYPNASAPQYRNGQKCKAGTPDAGKVGVVQARSWVLSTKVGRNGEQAEVGGATTTRPADLRFVNRQVITLGFVPAGQALPKPPASTITALVQVLAGNGPVATTTTTAPASTPTTTPAAPTTTTAPATPTTTTTKPTTTTTK